jgi:hypothetical protein
MHQAHALLEQHLERLVAKQCLTKMDTHHVHALLAQRLATMTARGKAAPDKVAGGICVATTSTQHAHLRDASCEALSAQHARHGKS